MTRHWLGTWRLSLRLARRDARQHPLRALLTLLLVVTPVAGLTAAAVSVQSARLPSSVQLRRQFGRADAVVAAGKAGGFSRADLAILTAPGSGLALLPDNDDRGPVSVGTIRLAEVELREVAYADPVASGLLEPGSGRAPHRTGEVAVSPHLLSRLHSGIGGQIEVGAVGSRTVVGTVRNPNDLAGDLVVGAPGDLGLRGFGSAYLARLTDTGGEHTLAEMGSRPGISVSVRGTYGSGDGIDPSTEELGTGALVVVLALLEAALAAGTAFAVGARRQRRTLALLGINGAGGRQVGRVLSAQGLLYGVAAATLGVPVGIALGWVALPLQERYGDQLLAGLQIPWWQVLGAAAFGIVASLLAAALPARLAARVPVRAALAGQRGSTRTPGWVTLGGLGLVMAGGLICLRAVQESSYDSRQTTGLLAGVVVLELGAVACCPALVGAVARLGGWLPAAPRLALRDASRQRARSGPAVAAVAAAVSGAMAVSIVVASTEARDRRDYQPSGPRTQAVIAPGDTAVDMAMARTLLAGLHPTAVAGLAMLDPRGKVDLPFDDSSAGAYAAGPDLLAAIGASPGTAADLAAGRAVVADATAVRDGMVALRVGGRRSLVMLPAVAGGWPVSTYTPALVISPAAAQAAGLPVGPLGEFAVIDPSVGRAARDAASGAAQDAGAYLNLEAGYAPRYGLVQLSLLGVAALLALAVTAVATALAGTEARDDLAILGAVGAAPSLRRRYGAAQAGVTAALGGVLGLGIGLVPAAAVIGGQHVERLPFTVPWQSVAAFAVGLPLLAALGGALLTRSRLPQVARRA